MDAKEKLEVIAHLGDHITYKKGVGVCYDIALAEVIEDAYMTLKNGVTEQRWIPVTERLPEDRNQLLCFGGAKGWEYTRIARFAICLETVDQYDFEGQKRSGFYGYDSEYGYYEETDITHWMPLPEPPKEDDYGMYVR